MRLKLGVTLRDEKPSVGRWMADHILGALIGLAVVTIVGVTAAIVFPGNGAPPPLATQWERERAAIAEEGWEVTTDRRVEMRGDTQAATILGLHRDAGRCSKVGQPSDQVRIYDVDDGRLQRTFTYQPIETGCHAWLFHIGKTADLTGSGRVAVFAEFVDGAFSGLGESIPVAISWSAHSHHYTLVPLITELPHALLKAAHAEGQGNVFQRESRRMFLTPIRLTSGTSPAYGASELRFVLRGDEDSFLYGLYRITSGVAAAGPSGPTATAPAVYQRALWHLEAGDTFAAGWCELSLREETAIVAFSIEPSAIMDGFARHGAHWISSCEAPLTTKWWLSQHDGEGS
jgi:hypothetical protein